jgi:thiamine biosynthesis lipoprotein
MRQIAVILCCVLLSACDVILPKSQNVTLRGVTMGTSYTIKIVDMPQGEDPQSVYEQIYADLELVNFEFSNWEPNSTVVKFNNMSAGEHIELSQHFINVMDQSITLSELSDGRFDVTLGPIIDLWGFGPTKRLNTPSDEDVQRVAKSVGLSEVLSYDRGQKTLEKRQSESELNFSAIAKGYAADVIAQTLQNIGIQNYMIEIGGDMIVRGVNQNGDQWRVAIEKPVEGDRAIELILSLKDQALASSGDYRNFYMEDGKRLSHIIDPKTMRPVTHSLASVSVIANDAAWADGLATALLVLGAQQGLAVSNEQNIAAYFIERTENGFKHSYSDAFAPYLN